MVLLARCDGHWKQVLYFLQCLLHTPGRSAPTCARSNVSAGCFCLQLLDNLAPFWVSVSVEGLSLVQSRKRLKMESQVVATAGANHTLIVDGKGELYITSKRDILCRVYRDIALDSRASKHSEVKLLTIDRQLHTSDLCKLLPCRLCH